MSRIKDFNGKSISPNNTSSQNLMLARFGEFANTTAFQKAFHWRFSLTLCKHGKKPQTKEREPKLFREIGEAVGRAIQEGDLAYVRALVKALEFVEKKFNWRIENAQSDLMAIFNFDHSKFKPAEKLRTLLVSEYHHTRGEDVDKAKRSRKLFMEYIRTEKGFKFTERTFDRACKDVGIRWPKKGQPKK